MRNIKWFFLAIWGLIYQLPLRVVMTFATALVIFSLVLFSWLTTSPNFIVGTLEEVTSINNGKVVIEVDQYFYNQSKIALVEDDTLQDELPKKLWILGYGTEQKTLNNGRVLLLLESHTVLFETALWDMGEINQILHKISNLPYVGIIIGALLILFVMTVLQSITAAIFGILTTASSWHLIYVGNFLNYWSLSDFVIYPLSVLLGVAGAAIGMRTSFGWTASIFHRIASATLMLFIFPRFVSYFAIPEGDIANSIITALIVSAIWAPASCICGGSVMIAEYLQLARLESIVLIAAATLFTLWVRYHQKQEQQPHRPHKDTATKGNGEMSVKNIFREA